MEFGPLGMNGKKLVGMVLEPRFQIWQKPLIGGDHLENLPRMKLSQRLRSFANRHWAEKTVAIENLIRHRSGGGTHTFQTAFILSAS